MMVNKKVQKGIVGIVVLFCIVAFSRVVFAYDPGAQYYVDYTWDNTVPMHEYGNNEYATIHSETIDLTSVVSWGVFYGAYSTFTHNWYSSSSFHTNYYMFYGDGTCGGTNGWDDYYSGLGGDQFNGDNLDGMYIQIADSFEGWWDLGAGNSASQIAVFMCLDHIPYLAENLECRVYGSNSDPSLNPPVSDQGTLIHIYLDGWRDHDINEDSNKNGWCSDDITGVVQLPTSYQYIKIKPWSPSSDNDGFDEPEIDAVAGVTILPTYTLTIQSAPISGVKFTANSNSHETTWSVTLPYGTQVDLEMPSAHFVGDAMYCWDQWIEDGYPLTYRTVYMYNDITLTALYIGPYYELTVSSEPTLGIPFTIDTASAVTPIYGKYYYYTSWVHLKMPWTSATTTAGDIYYDWDEWSDGVKNPERWVHMDQKHTLTAKYKNPYCVLMVKSWPIYLIPFKIDGDPHITPDTGHYSPGTHDLRMEPSYSGYVFDHWQDGDKTNPRTIDIPKDGLIWTAYYKTGPFSSPVGGKATPINTPISKPELPALWIWLPTIVLSTVATAIYIKRVKLRKRKQ